MPHRDQDWPPQRWEPPPLNADDVAWLRHNLAPAEPLPTQERPAPTPPAVPRGLRRDWWLRGPGVMVLIVVLGVGAVAVTGGFEGESPVSRPDAEAKVISCQTSGAMSLRTAAVGVEVRNHTDRTATFALSIEYVDDRGGLVDSDTAYARDVPAGGRVRVDETTQLPVELTSGSCKVSLR
jgi:hypothetical protein